MHQEAFPKACVHNHPPLLLDGMAQEAMPGGCASDPRPRIVRSSLGLEVEAGYTQAKKVSERV